MSKSNTMQWQISKITFSKKSIRSSNKPAINHKKNPKSGWAEK